MGLPSREYLLQIYKESLENKEQYWERQAEKLVWTRKWTSVLSDPQDPFCKWFPGGELNICYNCLDRHVNDGRGDKTAYIFDSPVTQKYRTYTYSEVLDKVSRLAGVLTSLGARKGNKVLICMPLIPQGAFSMLACARIGAINVCITGGLSSPDIARRIDHSKPNFVVMASHGYHSAGWMNYKADVDEACDIATHKPKKILVFQREEQGKVYLKPGRDLDWNDEMSKASPVGCISVEVDYPLLVIYTSGSTGEPKAIVHAAGLFAVRWIHDGTFILGMSEDDAIMGNVNYGWIGGSFAICYSPLLSGLSAVIFEGDCLLTEDPRLLYSMLSKNPITRAFVRPGIWKAARRLDPDGRIASEYNFERLSAIYVGGERVDMVTMQWVAKITNKNVFNLYGQTESGGLSFGMPFSIPGNEPCQVVDFGILSPGIVVKILTDDGQEAKPFEPGRLFIKHGVSPSSFVSILGNEELYLKKYFTDYPGYLNTMDKCSMDDSGNYRVEGRADDMMKVGLHYITSQAIEEVAMKHPSVSECVVVSSTDLVWKEIPVTVFVRSPGNSQLAEEIESEVHEMVHKAFGETLKLGRLIEVKELPITRTGKVHRPSCKDIVRGQELQGVSAVDNPEVFPDIIAAVRSAGYGKDVLHDE